jgi:N-acetylglutamate synthase-like GNAT family acetyltransferase
MDSKKEAISKINFSVRKAKASDVNEIYSLGLKTGELEFSTEFPFHEKAELKEFISHPSENILLVAIVEKKLVGFLYAKILSRRGDGWCMLDNIAVLKKYRDHGIGLSILNELYRELKKKRIFYVQILEEVHHKKTREFWKHRGFKEKKIFVWAEEMIK